MEEHQGSISPNFFCQATIHHLQKIAVQFHQHFLIVGPKKLKLKILRFFPNAVCVSLTDVSHSPNGCAKKKLLILFTRKNREKNMLMKSTPVENSLVSEYRGSIGNVSSSSYCRNHHHFSPFSDRPSLQATPFTLFKSFSIGVVGLLASSTIFTLYICCRK